MLISFTLENWKSFRDEVTFSMVASRERQHNERVPRLKKYALNILPISAIYGGNASGKTNFIQALSFAKEYVVKGPKFNGKINLLPFLLDDKTKDKPSRFSFNLLVDDDIYEFSFLINKEVVLEEKLVHVTSRSEKLLYRRTNNKIEFGNSIGPKSRLKIVFDGTQNNQLYLTNSVSQNVDMFKPIYDWFKTNLVTISPESTFDPVNLLVMDGKPFLKEVGKILFELDTGIVNISLEDVATETLNIPKELLNRIKNDLEPEGAAVVLENSKVKRYAVITVDDNGELSAKKVVAHHKKPDGKEIKFDLDHESSGSRRAIDLIPAIMGLCTKSSKMVFCVDELDRSLHTLLTRQLLEIYLKHCSSESRSQMIFTTHDLLLMDQKLMRRDEMWVTERNSDGSSELFALSDYKDIRKDKDIRKSYLQGRLGGIPRFLIGDALASECFNDGHNGSV